MKRSPIFALIAAAATAAAPSISFAEAPASPLLQRQAKVQQTARESGRAVVAILPGRGGAGMGSGVVVSKDGIILTAAHVLRAVGERFRVIFPDGTEAEARALGANFDRDAAMAKIATQREGEGGWPFAPLAPSASVVPGEWCVAMGHPGGYEAERPPPVRVGRVWKQSEPGFLLSDCTLAGGDSGGPLFDLDGRVIGIHSSIGGKVEQNLHVPADAFHKHWDALKAGRLWGSLNNTMRYDPRLADDPLARAVLGAKLDRDSVGGVRVVACPPEMPAAMAGLKPGDIILSAGGTATSGYSDLAGVLAEAAPEQAVALQVRRQGKETTIQVKLADREALASR